MEGQGRGNVQSERDNVSTYILKFCPSWSEMLILGSHETGRSAKIH